MDLSPDTLRSHASGAVLRLKRIVREPTISETWEQYARRHRDRDGVGDEWSDPARIGMDVSADRIVPYLVDEVVRPFLGTPAVLVEIGSGGGRFTGPLLGFCGQVIAADTSKTMLEIVRERYADRTNLRTQLLDGNGLGGIGDASVDAVFSYGVFVHLQHWDIYNYLAETARVLRPGGQAVIQHANTISELGWKRFVSEVPHSVNRHKRGTSFCVMTPELMGEFVTRAGLTLEACRTDVARRDGISFISKPAATAATADPASR